MAVHLIRCGIKAAYIKLAKCIAGKKSVCGRYTDDAQTQAPACCVRRCHVDYVVIAKCRTTRAENITPQIIAVEIRMIHHGGRA